MLHAHRARRLTPGRLDLYLRHTHAEAVLALVLELAHGICGRLMRVLEWRVCLLLLLLLLLELKLLLERRLERGHVLLLERRQRVGVGVGV